jgi:hypothetical protein
MNITINPPTLRTLLPINIDISGTDLHPEITVTSLATGQDAITPFHVDAKAKPGKFHADFWLEKSGDYTVDITSGAQHYQSILHVQQQIFLPFSIEFGVFSGLFLVTMLGVFLWLQKIRK